jgi:ATP-dependent Clp protease ATP-binding subunit ClpB
MIRIDMSEYQERHTVSRLVGAPPGYVGYEEGGQLTESVRRHPYSVVLLDEIEKAHPEVFNILLQMLDDGRLTDNQGRTTDFSNTIIIMTSNLGSEVIRDRLAGVEGEVPDELSRKVEVEVMNLLKKQLRPEFLNRIDEIVMFNPLRKSDIRQIVEIQFERIKNMVQRNQNVTLELSTSAMDWLGEQGYDPVFGARPLKRAIQRYLQNPMAMTVLEGGYHEGDTIIADRDGDHLVFRREATEAARSA